MGGIGETVGEKGDCGMSTRGELASGSLICTFAARYFHGEHQRTTQAGIRARLHTPGVIMAKYEYESNH